MTSAKAGARFFFASLLLVGSLASTTATAASRVTETSGNCAENGGFRAAGAKIRLVYDAADFELKPQQICAWVERSALAVGNYFGRFPVDEVRVVMKAVGSKKVVTGTTYGQMDDGPLIVIKLGDHADQASLDRDWVMTHEFVHLAVPFVPEQSHWLEEGIATYVEPIARVQTGELTEAKVWNDMVRDMPKGLPAPGDQGLDRTPTWGRTYWGGALFCMLADIEIRKRSRNQKSLRDALRGVLAAGGNIKRSWTTERFFAAGDKAIGMTVLTDLYKSMSTTPGLADLDDLWLQLGVKREDDAVMFSAKAPLSGVREALTSPDPPASNSKRPS